MTLPTYPDPISMDAVNVELGNSAATECNIRSMSSDFGFSTPDSMSEFHGRTWNDILLSMGTVTMTINNSGTKDGYLTLNHTGHTSPTIITITVNTDFVELSESAIGTIYYSVNSTSSWTTLGSFSVTDTNNTYNITNVAFDDVIRLRHAVNRIKSGAGYLDTDLTGGSITTSYGTVNTTGTTNWHLEV